MNKDNIIVSFWGVRGSIPVPGPDTIVYGGNTSCVQLDFGEHMVILDAGTGIYNLGLTLNKIDAPIYGDIFITHTHWDHIQGLPFFNPIFSKKNHFILHGPATPNHTFIDIISGQMQIPYFPLSLDAMEAQLEFLEHSPAQSFNLSSDILVTTLANNHPGGGLSYRFDYAGKACCYITDYEYDPNSRFEIIDFMAGANMVIFDTYLTEEEYPLYKGWGHSTWQDAALLVQKASAQQLILFHHAPYRTDKELALIEQAAQKACPNCLAAREGAKLII